MGQMSWLSYLIDTQNEKELVEFLKGKGFKDPKFAAKEFLKAGWICVLGSRQEFMKHVHCLPKGVWFIKSASNIDLPYIKIAKNYGHKIVCLDEEGLIVHNLEYFANNRVTADTIKKIDSIIDKFCKLGIKQSTIIEIENKLRNERLARIRSK